MLSKQLPLRFKSLVLRLYFLYTDNASDAFGEVRREGRRSNDVFVGALRVGGYEADGDGGRGAEGVRDGDQGGFESFGVYDVGFRCKC